jgi:ABC-type antimicrobial peptide transport system permease subunit
MKTLFRNLFRGGIYSVVNIAGLSIGLAAAILIFLWVQNERSFDSYHADTERIYRINIANKADDDITAGSPYVLMKHIKAEMSEVENAAAELTWFPGGENGIKIDDNVFSVKNAMAFVDKSWFEMFDYKLIDGSFEAFNENPYSLVLTESEAKKFFGNRRAAGSTVFIDSAAFTVQAVVEDNPANSSFRFKVLVSMSSRMANPMHKHSFDSWGMFNWNVFVKLRPQVDAEQAGRKITEILHGNSRFHDNEINLHPLKDIHFEYVRNSDIVHGDRKRVSIFGMLGLLLLITACINYVNLTTAKAGMRAKEVGIRKVIGARRISLLVQFIGESFVLSFISVCIALFLIYVLSPVYVPLMGNEISFDMPAIWIISAITLMTVTLLNGIYPALILSSFNPINTLKGQSLSKVKNNTLRRGLTVFQFTLSAALTVCVIVVYKQMHHIRHINPGYNREQVAILELSENASVMKQKSLKHELQSLPELAGVSLCNANIVYIDEAYGDSADWDGKEEKAGTLIKTLGADADYLNMMGLQLAAGRWFEDGNIADESNVVLNETAIREFKIHEPYIGQRFDFLGKKGKIIGIVKDFHFSSMYESITPLVAITSVDYQYYRLAFKIHAGMSQQALDAAGKVWNKFFPDAPFDYTFLDDAFNDLHRSDIKTSRLILAFSFLAVIIAALGLFALATFATERRTKEIGIRKVFGASAYSIAIMLTKEFVILVAVAFAIAAPLAWILMNRWLDGFAYRINISAWMLAAGGILTLTIALLAVGVQAYRAAIANPVKAIMNYEL